MLTVLSGTPGLKIKTSLKLIRNAGDDSATGNNESDKSHPIDVDDDKDGYDDDTMDDEDDNKTDDDDVNKDNNRLSKYKIIQNTKPDS